MKPLNLPADLVREWAAKLETVNVPDDFVRQVQIRQLQAMSRQPTAMRPMFNANGEVCTYVPEYD